MTTEDHTSGIEKPAVVATTEDGVVITGTKAEAFEARVMRSVRKPFFIISFVILVLIVTIAGGGIVLNNMNDTITHINATVDHIDITASNTDKVVSTATGPEAQQRQAETVKIFLSQVDCQQQRNLQRLIDNLVAAGMKQLATVQPLIEPQCQPPNP